MEGSSLMNDNDYGMELILDLHGCRVERFTRPSLEIYFEDVAQIIKAERAELHFWDYDDPEEFENAPPHLKGISAVQFITKSSLTVHALHDLKKVFVNIFSCGQFDYLEVATHSKKFFHAKEMTITKLKRI